MIKKVFTSLFLCFGLFFGISINDINVNAINELEELNDLSYFYNSLNDSMNINVTFEKNHYLLTEEIIINISYNTLEVEPAISYDSLGFNVVFENISVNGIIIKLIYNNLSFTPNMSLNINDINIKVYGLVDNDHGIFISKNSEDDAAFRSCDYIKIQAHTVDNSTKQCVFCKALITGGIIGGGSILSLDDEIIYYKEEDEYNETI